jgi:putative membrane protein
MIIALFFSIVFLFFYVIYHISISETIYGDITNDGILIQEELIFIQYFRYLYLIILLSHILFSIIVIPIVLLSIFFIYINNINYHKKLVRYAWPI